MTAVRAGGHQKSKGWIAKVEGKRFPGSGYQPIGIFVIAIDHSCSYHFVIITFILVISISVHHIGTYYRSDYDYYS